VLTEDTADMTIIDPGGAPALSEGERLIRKRVWDRLEPDLDCSAPIWGKRLGIMRMGRIGSAVARRARGFGSPSTTTIATRTSTLEPSRGHILGEPRSDCSPV